MTCLPLPADLARHLGDRLPGHPFVKVFPRDRHEKRCAAYAADHYELLAYYIEMGTDLAPLAAAFLAEPGVYATLTYTGRNADKLRYSEWPIGYRDVASWRPQVRALIRATP